MELSVVQVYNERTVPSYQYPWNTVSRAQSTGTGFCVKIGKSGKKAGGEGGKSTPVIITNAHCVHYSTYVAVRASNNTKYIGSRVLFICYETDLAIIEVPKELVKVLKPLKLVHTFSKMQKIFVNGFPLGGTNLSITKGIINRVRMRTYFQVIHGVVIQVDAPINFGNSGGPVTNSDGEVIGVAFSGENDATTQNMGYVIPPQIVNYFLRYYEKFVVGATHDQDVMRRYGGLCQLDISIQSMENQTIRRLFGDHDGVLVTDSHIPEIKDMDVIVSVAGKPMYSDGSIKFGDIDELVHYSSEISLHMPGDKVKIGVIRKGKQEMLDVIVNPILPLVPFLDYQLKPSYVFLCGLVFLPLSYMLIDEKRSNREYIYGLISLFDRNAVKERDGKKGESADGTERRQQIVILSENMTNDVTEGYNWYNLAVESVNDTDVWNLAHFYELVHKDVDVVRIKFRNSSNVVYLTRDDIARNDELKMSLIGNIPDHAL